MEPTYYVNVEIHIVPETIGTNREFADRPEPIVIGIYADRDLAEAEAIKARLTIERTIEIEKLPPRSVRVETLEGHFFEG
jgi:hypothetical protein